MASLIKYEELIGFYDKGFVDLKQIRHIKKAGKGTVESKTNRPPRREERRFLYFNHLSTEFLEQMIPHLKALI